jgi:hypothetical protein
MPSCAAGRVVQPTCSSQWSPLHCQGPLRTAHCPPTPKPPVLPCSREDVLRGIRKDATITNRIARRTQQQEAEGEGDSGERLATATAQQE